MYLDRSLDIDHHTESKIVLILSRLREERVKRT